MRTHTWCELCMVIIINGTLWLKMVYLQLKHLLEFHAQGDHQTKSVYLRTTVKYLKLKAIIYIKFVVVSTFRYKFRSFV